MYYLVHNDVPRPRQHVLHPGDCPQSLAVVGQHQSCRTKVLSLCFVYSHLELRSRQNRRQGVQQILAQPLIWRTIVEVA